MLLRFCTSLWQTNYAMKDLRESSMSPVVQVVKMGRVDYEAAWRLQKAVVAAKRAGSFPDTLLLLEHPPVYTMGRRRVTGHLLVPRAQLEWEGLRVYEIERGGDITFHGPGQLVGYPILNLQNFRRDINLYLRRLEEVLIETLRRFNIAADRQAGLTGAWVGDTKLAAIGIHVQGWVTMHGFALNVNTDLAYFDRIIPCGIRDKRVGSMAQWLGDSVRVETVADTLIECFGRTFGVIPQAAPLEALDAALGFSAAGNLSDGEGRRRIS